MSQRVTDIAKACVFVNGERRYIPIGRLLTDENGRISLKIDTLPLPSVDWKGWVNFFPATETDESF